MSSRTRFDVELLEEFRRTTRERLERVAVAWVHIEQEPRDQSVFEDLRRELHSLKGEARMLGFFELSRIAHAAEELLSFCAARNFREIEAAGDLLLAAADALERMLQAEPGERSSAELCQKILERFDSFMSSETAPAPLPNEHGGAEEHALAAHHEARNSDASLRVDAGVVGWLSSAAGEIIVAYTQHERVVASLRAIAEQLSSTLQIMEASVSHPAVAELFAIEKQLRGIIEVHAQRIHEGELQTREIEHRTRELRLVPVRSLFERYVRQVRDLAREQQKRIRLNIVDNGVTIDKVVVDTLAEPLLHLVRNSIDHGIETRDERARAQKSEEAILELGARQSHGYVTITIFDDGRGIDPKIIRARAQELGMASPAMNDEEILSLLFHSGFSTKRDVTELSGRGIGLSVVKHQVVGLGGMVQVFSEPGAWTRFELKTPISVALSHVLVVAVAETLFAIPVAGVLGVTAMSAHDVAVVGGATQLRFRDDWIPFCDLSSLLGAARGAHPERVVVLAHEGRALALGISSWHAETEAVIKPLGPLFSGNPMVAGGCVLEEGDLALVLNIAEVVRRSLALAA